jgi:hypothetical protein
MFGAHPSVTILTSFHRKKEENIHSSQKEREKWAFVTERKRKMGIHIYMSYPWATERPGVRASPYLPSRFATERIKEHEPKNMNKYNRHVHKHIL